jgi:hypothetical protein
LLYKKKMLPGLAIGHPGQRRVPQLVYNKTKHADPYTDNLVANRANDSWDFWNFRECICAIMENMKFGPL